MNRMLSRSMYISTPPLDIIYMYLPDYEANSMNA